MKKIAILATIFAVFMIYNVSCAAPREFISEKSPEEVMKLIEGTPVVGLDRKIFSSKGDGVIDYGILYFTTEEHYLESVLNGTDPPIDAIAIYALTPIKDEDGNDSYSGEFVGVIFKTENVQWFKNQKVKGVYEKATR